MFKVMMMAIFYGLIKVALWIWRVKWWIVTLLILLELVRHHAFAGVAPWYSSLHLSMSDQGVISAIFAGIGGLIIGALTTFIIMKIREEDKFVKKGDWHDDF